MPRIIRKRTREVLSCTECHRRKQKCDRGKPCSNCTRRERQDFCHYGHTAESSPRINSSRDDPSQVSDEAYHSASLSPEASQHDTFGRDIPDQLRGLGYMDRDKCNSIRLVKVAEECLDAQTRDTMHAPDASEAVSERTISGRRYTEFVRRLPSQPIVEALLKTYFALTNWEYDLLDKQTFHTQLTAWRSVPYSDLQKQDLSRLDREVLSFPVLLFQVLAQALLVHPPQDSKVGGLLNLAGMTLHDVAAEYSNVGAELLAFLGKGGITTITVQAGVLRVAFLKSSGDVVEAWHTLGSTIRDAQEIGLDDLSDKSKLPPSKQIDTREAHEASAVRKKVWLVLHIWDAHMAVVLGRPMATQLHLDSFIRSFRDSDQQSDLLEHWRTESEPPRPFDFIMAGYSTAYCFLQDIHELEHHQSNFAYGATVGHIHATIMQNLASLPSWCRLEDPSSRFDTEEGLQWIPAARETLHTLVHVVVLALHRPHVFRESTSRTEALAAGMVILRAQERMFQNSERHWRILFTPVYATFDAVVLMVAIFMAFPTENAELRADCLEAVERAIHQLWVIGRSNDMAKIAHKVALSLYGPVKHYRRTDDTGRDGDSCDAASIGRSSGSSSYTDTSFDAIGPPHPIQDLFYYDLSVTLGPQLQLLPNGEDSWSADASTMWTFEGDFEDTSFWSTLNDLNAK